MTPAQVEVLTRLRATVAEMKDTIARHEAGEVLIYTNGQDTSAELAENLRQLVAQHEATLAKFDPEGLTA